MIGQLLTLHKHIDIFLEMLPLGIRTNTCVDVLCSLAKRVYIVYYLEIGKRKVRN